MKFLYYRNAQRKKALAFYFDPEIIDAKEAAEAAGICLPENFAERMPELDPDTLTAMETLYCRLKEQTDLSTHRIPVGQAELLPLISREENSVFCVGRNFKSSGADMNKASEKNVQPLERPAFFFKPNRSIVCTGNHIVACSDDTSKLDYEGEVGLVIGKQGKDISVEDADTYIFGYTVCNDVSARDTMKAYYQMYKGKSMDTFAPIGPCISTREEIPDYRNINIRTKVNGAVRQCDNTANLIFDFPILISFLSRGTTLYPGDIIMTGTPAGIGAACEPPVFLQHGDTVEITVDGVGTLRNDVEFYSRSALHEGEESK